MQNPFRINAENLTISIYVYSEENQEQTEILEKYEIYPNGPGWEGVVEQILEQADSNLLEKIDFDSEGDAFFAYADSKETLDRFQDVLVPIFTHLESFENYIQNIDKDRIDA